MIPAVLLVCAMGSGGEAPTLTGTQRERLLRLGPMPAAPVDPTNRFSGDPAAAELGRWLFHETRLSRDDRVSCASCHRPDRGFADGLPRAVGIAEGPRHTQSLLDAAH